MCDLCKQYGSQEHGDGVWYLNPYNYARNMYKLRAPGVGHQGVEASPETATSLTAMTDGLVEALDTGNREEYDRIIQQKRHASGGAQVVPLKDADKVLELCSPTAAMACLCRKNWRDIDERSELEYTCMGMGVGMFKAERWPERYKGGVKFFNLEEAKEWNHEMDKRGFVHILMLFGAPFIGGFCQCDYPVCNMIRWVVDFGFGMLKSHYVAKVDYSKCNGCGVCAQRCQFGALKFEVTSEKANIDQFQCYGCGLCESGCPRGAIELAERVNIPALREVW